MGRGGLRDRLRRQPTIFGLASALLGDGVWDVLSWITLAVPLAVCVWFASRATDRSSARR